MNVSIITIGEEILIGQIVDTNSAWMAQQLNLIGAKVTQIYSIGDTFEDIANALDIALKQADVVLMTGGLGSTKDDITKKVIADFLGAEMQFHQATWEKIQQLFQRWGRSTTPAHREQCFMPSNAILLNNKMGTAPGMWFEKDQKVIVSMPGVPYEMKYLMEFEVIPKLKIRFSGKPIAHRTILTVGEGESRIAARIETIENNLPSNVKLAFLPALGTVRLRLSGRAENGEDIAAILDKKVAEIKTLIPDLIYGYGTETLEGVIGKRLRENKLTLATAESCTGGLLAYKITAASGASDYFKGSIIAYANEVKMSQLQVKKTTLMEYGAVSEQTVKEMIQGLLSTLDADIGIAISGIAGPKGGSPEKPVGTIWLAIGNKQTIETIKLQLSKDRLKNIQYTTVVAMNRIRLFIQAHYTETGSALE